MCKLGQWECCDEESGGLGCGCSCEDCCSCADCRSMFCLSYSHLIAFARAFFLFLHTLLVAISVFGLIWANVYFNDFDNAITGSFIGGHLATLSAGNIRAEYFDNRGCFTIKLMINQYLLTVTTSFPFRWPSVWPQRTVRGHQAPPSTAVHALDGHLDGGFAARLYLAPSDAARIPTAAIHVRSGTD